MTGLKLKKHLYLKMLFISVLLLSFLATVNAFGDVIIDNRAPQTSQTGTWGVSGAPNPYGADSVWSRDETTFTWHFVAPQTSDFELLMWWTEWPSRSASVPVDIEHANGTTQVIIDQRVNGGRWNSLGEYPFLEGNSYSVTITAQPGPSSTCADAVRFLPILEIPTAVIIDNRDASKTSQTGTWGVSGAPDPYDADSVWSRDGTTFTWHFDPALTGHYELSMWWTEWPSRSSSVPVDIEHEGGTTQVIIDQTADGGQWNSLGEYPFQFGQSYRITITSQPGPSSTCADAVSFVSVEGTPTADFSADPLSGPVPLTVQFTDASTGAVNSWEWNFNDDSTVDSFERNPTHTYDTPGSYTVRLKVSGPAGDDETFKTGYITVGGPAAHDIIIDNRDDQTSQTGTWGVSGGADPYGADSVWSRDGDTFSWHFVAPQTSHFELLMWWTEWSSRSTSIPVEIEHDGGTATVFINQRFNGGQWNRLGEYPFQSGQEYKVTITAQTGPSSTCADAVRFVSTDVGTITAAFTADPVSGSTPLTVNFTDRSTGTITGWAWDFDNNGTVNSTEQNPSHTYNSAGSYTVKLTVTGPDGNDNEVKEGFISVGEPIVPPVADFSATPLSGQAPLEVQFTDSSMGTVNSWAWDFGDGGQSTAQYPSHTYNTGGTYTVKLTVTGPDDSDTLTQDDYITVNGLPQAPTADFTANPTSGTAPLAVQFTDASSGSVESWAWDFGDGVQSTVQNPSHIYTAAGSYTVSLIVTGPGGSHTETKTNHINVSEPAQAPVAAFTAAPVSGSAPLEVTFTDGSSGDVTSWSWDFGDGGQSAVQNPTHTYTTAGSYTVSLTVSGSGGVVDEVKTNLVNVTEEGEEQMFVGPLYTGSGSIGLKTNFINMLQSLGAWQDGDVWRYTNAALNKNYVIHFVHDNEALKQALKTEGAHILLSGHANYGTGAVFATEEEILSQRIWDLQYIDDDRFFKISTPVIHPSLTSLRNSHSFHYFWPVFKDGTSGIMPYEFGEPQGPPAFNYRLTYQVPGDPTHYMINSPKNSAISRFPGMGASAWYSSAGNLPDPNNPSHRTFFITNPPSWVPSTIEDGNWVQSRHPHGPWGHFGEDFVYAPAGSGDSVFEWLFEVPEAGDYKVYSMWPNLENRTTSAPYTVNHSLGSTPLSVNQNANARRWNQIGEFYFAPAQGWYESREDEPGLLTLDESNIGDNSTKKAKFQESLTSNAYLTQQFDFPQETPFSISWDIYVDSILDDLNRDRAGMMLIGADSGSGPNRGTGPFTYLAFWSPGGGSGPTDTMTLIAREPGNAFNDSTQWKPIATGLSFNTWYTIEVHCDPLNRTYDVYVNGERTAVDVAAANNQGRLTHISFAQFNDGAGTFFVDNVLGSDPGLLVDSDFEAIPDSEDLRNKPIADTSIVLTNSAGSGNVIADAVRVAHADNPPITVQADFRANRFSGAAPLTVTFTDQSTGMAERDITSRRLYFGDGTSSGSYTTSNTKTYTNPGTYTVTLEVSGPSGSSVKTKQNYITVGESSGQVTDFRTTAGRTYTHPATVAFRIASSNSGTTATRLWSFGDGGTSTAANPSYIYSAPGLYTVSLTVNGVTEIKENFIRVVVSDRVLDNREYPKTHAGGRTFIHRKEPDIQKEEMRYARMIYSSCSSGPYYAGTFNRGIMFYTLSSGSTGGYIVPYARAYLEGKNDEEIWADLQRREPIWDYYDFNKRPDEQ